MVARTAAVAATMLAGVVGLSCGKVVLTVTLALTLTLTLTLTLALALTLTLP